MTGSRRPAARSKPSVEGLAARRAAYEVLRGVTSREAYANLLLPSVLTAADLPERDRALATELAYGTLRATGSLDFVIGLASSRGVQAVDPVVLDALRLGAFQLLRTRIAPHAAVSTSVSMVRELAGEGASRFANAVLRRIAERATAPTEEERWGAPPFEVDPLRHLELVHCHPRWVVEAFRDALGGDLTETRAALAADDERPVTHLVARPGLISRDELAAQAAALAIRTEAGPWSPYALRLVGGGDPARLPAVQSGLAAVQDEGSQLVALAMTAAVAQEGSVDGPWIDLCAGPGGKAGLLAALAPGRVVALEPRAVRAGLVARAVRERGLTVQGDGLQPPLRAGRAERVLVDAPCSGLGALRRRPEARWRKQPSDVAGLGALQRALLRSAIALTAPGGVVVYATCSPHVAETKLVVEAACQDAATTQIDARELFPGVPDLGPGPSVQLWPHRHGTDAMFLSALRVR